VSFLVWGPKFIDFGCRPAKVGLLLADLAGQRVECVPFSARICRSAVISEDLRPPPRKDDWGCLLSYSVKFDQSLKKGPHKS
jgi:hypothetical protein